MNPLTTYTIRLHLASGTTVVTTELFDDDLAPEEVLAEVRQRITKRDGSPFREIGHTLTHTGAISSVEVESLG